MWTSETSIRQPFACVHSRGHIFDQIFMKLCQNVNLYEIRSGSKLGHVGSKTRSLGQILDKHRGHSLEQKSMKLCQNVNSHKAKSSLKLGHVGSKTRSLGQIINKKPLVYAWEGTVLIRSSWNFVRTLILIKSRWISKHWNIVHVVMPTQACHSFFRLWFYIVLIIFYASISKITWIFLLHRLLRWVI